MPPTKSARSGGRPSLNRSAAEKQAMHTASQRRLHQERRAQGLCIRCGRERDESSKALCRRHASVVKLQKRGSRARSRERKKQMEPRIYNVGGEMLSVYDLAALTALSTNSVRQRLRVGQTPELILRRAGRSHERVVTLSSRPHLSPEDAVALLDAHNGNVSAAARAANLPRGTFRKRVAKGRLGGPCSS